MAHAIILQLSDDMYAAVQQVAQRSGKAPEAVALEGVARHVAESADVESSGSGNSDAWSKLLRHAGAVSSGDPTGASRNRIDADLAIEYAADQEL